MSFVFEFNTCMQLLTYQINDSTMVINYYLQDNGHSSKELSKEELVAILSSISNEIKDIPANHLFSSTILQFISTVFFLSFYHAIAFYR